MGSSKTANLLIQAYSFEERNIPFICLKPSVDTRDGNKIRSRIGIERECAFIEEDTDVFKAIKTYDAILQSNGRKLQWTFVDECQFLSKAQVDDLAKVVDFLDINVCCYGLRSDFQSNSFTGSRRLFELADEINEIKSTCKCGRKAIINARIDENGHILREGDSVSIEGETRYEAMCRKCWLERQ